MNESSECVPVYIAPCPLPPDMRRVSAHVSKLFVEGGFADLCSVMHRHHYCGGWLSHDICCCSIGFSLFSDFSGRLIFIGAARTQPHTQKCSCSLLGAAIQVSVSESAMDTPRHRGPAFMIARASQPGKFQSCAFEKTASNWPTDMRRVICLLTC